METCAASLGYEIPPRARMRSPHINLRQPLRPLKAGNTVAWEKVSKSVSECLQRLENTLGDHFGTLLIRMEFVAKMLIEEMRSNVRKRYFACHAKFA